MTADVDSSRSVSANSSHSGTALRMGAINPLPTFKLDAMNGAKREKAVFASNRRYASYKVPGSLARI